MLAEEVIRLQAESDSPEQQIAETARDILQNTEDYMDSVKESLEEDLSTGDTSAGAAYQCVPSSEDPGTGYTSNGPDGISEDER